MKFEKIPSEIIEEVHNRRNEIGCCPVCNSNIKDRTVSLYRELLDELYKVYCWCGERGQHEFKMEDIRHLLSKNGYSRFNNLTRFGGIVYRPEKKHANSGSYGINMKRAKAFFKGEYKIPMQIVIDQITNKKVAASYASIYDMPELYQMLREDGTYDYEQRITVEVDHEKQKSMKLPTVEEYDGGEPLPSPQPEKKPEPEKCEHGLPTFVQCPNCAQKKPAANPVTRPYKD